MIGKTHNADAAELGLDCLRGVINPPEDVLEKCYLTPGHVFDCKMGYITRGTCEQQIISFIKMVPQGVDN
jgi:hypothetical protein